jgi:TonB family protein
MIISKQKISGYIGSSIFCGLLYVFLRFTFLLTKIEPKEQGVLVNFGTVNWASGTFEPRTKGSTQADLAEKTENTDQSEIVANQPEIVPSAIIQDRESTAAVDVAKQQRTDLREQVRLEQEQERKKKEAELQRIEAQMQGAFGVGETSNGSEGTASTGTGNQGSLQGNAPVGSYVGVGDYGGYDLAGRKLGPGGLPRPAYSVQEEGTIVLNITVDPQGKVIAAEIGKGTNITNSAMRNSAMEAAKKAKFNTITGNNNQSGTITFRYKLY